MSADALERFLKSIVQPGSTIGEEGASGKNWRQGIIRAGVP